MGLNAAMTLVILTIACILLFLEVHTPDLILLAAMLALALAGVLTPSQVLQGFSDPATFTIAGMLIVGHALRRTGALDSLMLRRLLVRRLRAWRLLGVLTGVSPRMADALARLASMGLVLPPVLGDVGTVAHLLPRALRFSRRLRMAPSRLLLPLAYAATVGGGLTLLGSVTNLMVSGLLEERGHSALGMWTQSGAALAGAGVTLVLLVALTPRLLADRQGLLEEEAARSREYMVATRLDATSPMVGRTVQAAGLRALRGLFLVRIDRPGEAITPVGPLERLAAGDRLIFAGSVETIRELQGIPGLAPEALGAEGLNGSALIEAVVSDSSPLVGVSVRDSAFRSRYRAAVVSVHRHGGRQDGRLGDVVLHPGDTLLLQAEAGFAKAFQSSADFFVVSEVEESDGIRADKANWAAFFSLGLLLLVGVGLTTPLKASLLAAIGVILTGCITVGEGRKAVKPALLMTFAMGFPIAEAVEKTGLGAAGADALLALTGPSPVGAMAAVLLVTVALTQLAHNVVAAAAVFPVALSAAGAVGAPVHAFAVAVAVGASLSFLSPRSYQTLRLVDGPGRYAPADYLRLGAPLLIATSGCAILSISFFWGLTP